MARLMVAAGFAFSFLLLQLQLARGDLVISEFLANPNGSDSPQEYVELVATRNIDFAATPYSVVFANNGSATADGWVAGNSKTYAFNIGSGTVSQGDVVYVGGTLASPIAAGATTLRALHTGTTNGDGFGNASTGGVLGNGGASADAIAVFNAAAGSITSDSRPVDSIFFGDAIGNSFVNSTSGLMLPNNDRYAGGRLQSDSFLYADASSGQAGIFSGTFDVSTGQWLSARTLDYTSTAPAFGTTSLSITASAVPEPGSYFLALLMAIFTSAYAIVKRYRFFCWPLAKAS